MAMQADEIAKLIKDLNHRSHILAWQQIALGISKGSQELDVHLSDTHAINQ